MAGWIGWREYFSEICMSLATSNWSKNWPRHERTREEETDPTAHCIQIRLGVKRTASGKNEGAYRAIQGRCTSCRIRRKKNNSKWVTPPTAWGCACHRSEYFCKNKTCWSEHLKAVRDKTSDMFAIWIHILPWLCWFVWLLIVYVHSRVLLALHFYQ